MSTGEEKVSTSVCFPEGLRVLVVDKNSRTLQEIIEMCVGCKYVVTAATGAIEALSILRETRRKFDIVLSDIDIRYSDIDIRDMDPFEFIKIVSVKMDLPLVLMSADESDNNTVVKGLISGACDYKLKPLELNDIKFIWKHVVCKQNYKAMEQSKAEFNVENCQKDGEIMNVIDKEEITNGRSVGGGVEKDDEYKQENEISQKKQRIVWSSQLHEKFVAIVNQIGVKNAVPKKILDMMNVPGLTRENVASHLQKYRMYLRKIDESMQQKLQMQTQAIHLEFNPQMFSYNSQNQVNFDQTKLQFLAQRRSNSFGYIYPPHHFSPENYTVPDSRFGLQRDNGVNHEILSQKIPPDQFSGNSLMIQRPLKIQKLNHDDASESLCDALWDSTTTFPSTTDDVSTRSSSQFCENDFSLQNSDKVLYDGSNFHRYHSFPSFPP